MSGQFLLDWAIMAVSLFNTILMLWLGLAVLLNAERRTWGVWLASGGLLLGGVFFVSHSAILGYGLDTVSLGSNFWWRVGWVPVIALPFGWYLVMLWYASYWDDAQTPLHQRHRPWLALTSLLVVGLVGLFAFANPLPSFWQVAQLNLTAMPSVAGFPLLILLYPLYIVLCIGLSLDVLRQPAPPERMMGDLARRRARPWLVSASVVLLLVSLLVAWIVLWVVVNSRQRVLYDVYGELRTTVALFDLAISSLIALAVVLLGQATVAYEVFAGKTLPRRGLVRHWHRAVLLAAGYGLAVGGSLTLQLGSVYVLLLTAMLMTLFYALLSWRSYVERERYMDLLRPFVTSQRLYEHLLTPSTSSAPDAEVKDLFRALCGGVLGARLAYLVPLGPLTPLVGSALVYPEGEWAAPPSLTGVTERLEAPERPCVAVDDANRDEVQWAVPLRSQRRLIGVLLLGEKQDGGLYTEEEIELAQASGERLMDTLASAEIARRLMALERQRLAESQDVTELSRAVYDQSARRLLHDEVLPLLHTSMLSLSGGRGEGEALELLADAHRQISDLLREMPASATPQLERLGLVGALQEIVEDELAGAFDDVKWAVERDAVKRAEALPSLTVGVLHNAAREAMRNAARHGRSRESRGPFTLCVKVAWREGLEILIEDDGVGLETSGDPESSGQGLALHSTMMAVVGGILSVESQVGVRTSVKLALPRKVWPDSSNFV